MSIVWNVNLYWNQLVAVISTVEFLTIITTFVFQTVEFSMDAGYQHDQAHTQALTRELLSKEIITVFICSYSSAVVTQVGQAENIYIWYIIFDNHNTTLEDLRHTIL